ncbi:MAG: tail sheath stabilizer and completion protein, partial [Minisyncoccia bacterium]
MLNGQYFYNQTLKKAVAVFGTVFNNIKTLKPGGDKTYNRVPLAYGPRKKFIARIQTDLIGPDKETIAIKLPRMSFEISS